jgi:hypothetical protein
LVVFRNRYPPPKQHRTFLPGTRRRINSFTLTMWSAFPGAIIGERFTHGPQRFPAH